MKGKTKRVLAGFMAFLMAFSLLPLSLLSNTVIAKAEATGLDAKLTSVHTVAIATVTAGTDLGNGFQALVDFATTTDKAKAFVDKAGNSLAYSKAEATDNCIAAAANGDAISFTAPEDGTVKIAFKVSGGKTGTIFGETVPAGSSSVYAYREYPVTKGTTYKAGVSGSKIRIFYLGYTSKDEVEATPGNAEETTPAPEETTPAPEGTTPAPEGTTPAPEGTTPAPVTPSVLPGHLDLAKGLKVGTVYGDPAVVNISVLENMDYKSGSSNEAEIDSVLYPGYIQGATNPSPSPKTALPTSGAVFVLDAVEDCSVSFVTNTAKNNNKVWYLYEDSTLVKSSDVTNGTLKLDLTAGKKYTFALAGSKLAAYDIYYKSNKPASSKIVIDLTTGLKAGVPYGDSELATLKVLENMDYKDGSSNEAEIDSVLYPGYIQGTTNPSPSPKTALPTSGAVFVIEPVKDCSVSFVTSTVKNNNKVWYLYEDSTLVKSGDVTTGTLKLDLTAGKTYSFALAGSKLAAYSIVLDGGVVGLDWTKVAAPVLANPVVDGKTVNLDFTGVIGDEGGEKLQVEVKNASGETVTTLNYSKEGSSGTVKYVPTASGRYSFVASLVRDGMEPKTSNEVSVDFSLPLEKPVITVAASAGNGKITAIWSDVPEAEYYEVYVDGVLAGTATECKYTAEGLTVGVTYAITVVAVRGSDKSAASDANNVLATANEQGLWGHTFYGSSTSSSGNGYSGDANNGSVTVYSVGGKGKIVPNSTDGISFYYTAVPTDTNFTLKAKVHVDTMTYSNGQEGFGLIATDQLGPNDNGGVAVWNNSYMALISKIEYYWNSEEQKAYSTANGSKYKMDFGVGCLEKVGVTAQDIVDLAAGKISMPAGFVNTTTTLETSAVSKDSGTYNIVGNLANATDGENIAQITDFILEIQKNNTGYFVTYYDEKGNVIGKVKNYDPSALSQIDADNVYVGFFASRNAKATFTDIEFKTILASEDAPAEERPITYVPTLFKVPSSNSSNSEEFTLEMYSNVDGDARVIADGVELGTVKLTREIKYNLPVTLVPGWNNFEVWFTPDPTQDLGEYTALQSTETVYVKHAVDFNNDLANRVNIYVAPFARDNGLGSKTNPISLDRAVRFVQPGQTIIMLEGTYTRSNPLVIQRGVDGTADKPIRLIADPEASTRPVIDFNGECTGITLAGNYWYLQGFDVTRSLNGQKGLQVSGSNNVLDSINAYHNGNTGIQISRWASTDSREEWPSNNLILNCTSYGNADKGYEDADGFAAKLTIGDGNVFDGCISYNNADDGWDLFAKVETGPIGSVTIKNCVAYGNGYLEDGTNAGNGNGFKMGGDSLTGYHKLINSYAFFNKAKGIDSNSCPDIQVENSISYNNESYNVAFYTNNAVNTDFGATGIISFKDATIKSGLETPEQHKPKGNQDETKYIGTTNYYWNGTESVNSAGEKVTADWFKTLEFTGITRNADGTINMNGFLELTDKATAGVGAVPGGTPSSDVVVGVETAIDPVEEETSSGSAIVVTPSTETENVIQKTTDYDNYIPVSVFEELIASGKTLVVDVVDGAGTVVATYTIDGTKFTVAPAGDFRLLVTEDAKNQGIVDIVKASFTVDASAIDIIDFEHVGELNGPIKVKVQLLSKKFAPGTKLSLYYFNEKTRTLEDQKQVLTVAEDNSVEFTITHCSSYVLIPTDAAAVTPGDNTSDPTKDKVPATADASPLGLALAVMAVSAVAFVESKKRKITE